LFSSNNGRLKTRFSKWFYKATFLVCTIIVHLVPERQSISPLVWSEWLMRDRILLLLIPLPHFWTGGASRFEKKEKMSYNLTMKKKELTQILQEGEGQFVEFKEKLDNSLVKEIVA
jgi:hypothetical protein